MEDHDSLSYQLAQWYDANHRQMPWRKTNDAYTIWLSEIILQQTQVIQGTPYFEKFINEIPTLKNLAESSEDKVLKLWQGLGYYSRARNLLQTAKHIYFELNGVFPGNYNDLLKLKGVGEYTAAAIASIAYDEPVAVVDGNVIRVISRLFKINEPANTSKGIKIIKELANQVLDKNHPATHNQAMMELGSLVCRPQNPNCTNCPLEAFCLSRKDNTMLSYPLKSKKTVSKKLFFNFVVPLLANDKTLITKRTANAIWKNMYTFPLYEMEGESNENDFFQVIKNDFGDFELFDILVLKHILSHRVIAATFYLVALKNETHHNVSESVSTDRQDSINPTDFKNKYKVTSEKNNTFEVEIKSLTEFYSLPRLITKYIESKEVKNYFM